MIKIGGDVIAEPLTQVINCCFRQDAFPDNAKITSVVPRDKGKSKNYDFLNYRPISILSDFSKIYEKGNQKPVRVLLWSVFPSSYIGVYKKLQHPTGSYLFDREMVREIGQIFYCGCSFNRPI